MKDFQLLLKTGGGLFQGYLKVVAQVFSALWAGPPSAPFAAEKHVEEVAELAKTFRALETAAKVKTVETTAPSGRSGLSVVIVPRPFLRVREKLVSAIYLFELISGASFLIDVGVVLAGEIAVSPLDLLR